MVAHYGTEKKALEVEHGIPCTICEGIYAPEDLHKCQGCWTKNVCINCLGYGICCDIAGDKEDDD
jgi:hypothetical protein